mmetsp:Transcript_58676/g.117850  ORF Transcript_58676/g.117850 Transcript_58676/m.117850 type:complete len:188 (-) Transcript_58676:45-608(-)
MHRQRGGETTPRLWEVRRNGGEAGGWDAVKLRKPIIMSTPALTIKCKSFIGERTCLEWSSTFCDKARLGNTLDVKEPDVKFYKLDAPHIFPSAISHVKPIFGAEHHNPLCPTVNGALSNVAGGLFVPESYSHCEPPANSRAFREGLRPYLTEMYATDGDSDWSDTNLDVQRTMNIFFILRSIYHSSL